MLIYTTCFNIYMLKMLTIYFKIISLKIKGMFFGLKNNISRLLNFRPLDEQVPCPHPAVLTYIYIYLLEL